MRRLGSPGPLEEQRLSYGAVYSDIGMGKRRCRRFKALACGWANSGLPLDDSFLVLIILAANSSPVDFWTHRRTIENAPLQEEKMGETVSQEGLCLRWRKMGTTAEQIHSGSAFTETSTRGAPR